MFSGEVISNLRDLQSLTIDTSAEKEKQKAEVKHILQQKQRALSDLFKMLTEIGGCCSLSYRCAHLTRAGYQYSIWADKSQYRDGFAPSQSPHVLLDYCNV